MRKTIYAAVFFLCSCRNPKVNIVDQIKINRDSLQNIKIFIQGMSEQEKLNATIPEMKSLFARQVKFEKNIDSLELELKKY